MHKKGLSGNVGIWSDKADAHFNDCFVIDYTVGMRLLGAANRISRCHLWGGTVPPESYSVEEWSEIYGARKQNLSSGVYGKDNNGEYKNETPEMLKNSIAFDIQGTCNILDGCYADTAEIGCNINAGTRMIGCDYFNNNLMGMKKSIAINHTKGKLQVLMSTFRATAGFEVLYSGNIDDVDWSMNEVSGFAENAFEK